jgi:hypothetical protein
MFLREQGNITSQVRSRKYKQVTAGYVGEAACSFSLQLECGVERGGEHNR